MNRTEAYNWLTGYLEGIKAGENALNALNIIYAGEPIAIKAVLEKPVSYLTMSVRAANYIKFQSWNPETRKYESTYKNAINTVADLVRKTESDLLKTPNFGRKSLNELRAELARHNLRFGMDV